MKRIYEKVTKHPEVRGERETEDALGPMTAERVVQANADCGLYQPDPACFPISLLVKLLL